MTAPEACAWCPNASRGRAWHNDGRLYPSCGQIDHGQGWTPDASTFIATDLNRSIASEAAYRAYIEADGATFATRDLTNHITDAILAALETRRLR